MTLPGTAREQPFGTCPHCGARITFPAGSQRCAACKGSYLTIVPEEDAAGTSAEGPSEWALLPLGSTRGRAARAVADGGAQDPGAAEGEGAPQGGRELTLVPLGSALGGAMSWLDARELRRPLRALAALEAIGIAGVFSAGAVPLLLDPGPRAWSVLKSLMFFFLLMVALPAIALVAVLVVRVLFGRRRANEPRVFWRSVITVTLGFATCWAAALLLSIAIAAAPPATWRWLEPDWITFPAILSILLASLLAGWLTGRLALSGPFRHALGVWLLLVLPFAPALLFSGWQGVAVLSLAWLVQLSMLWLGAWLAVRSRPPIETPAAAA